MADYAIGDLQGCYDPLQRLLDAIDFDDKQDRLWFTGDLVNRGTQSLEVLRFVKGLPLAAKITLGNHDLHLLASLFSSRPWKGKDDTIEQVLKAVDGEELGHWLRQQAILLHDDSLGIVMTHAGISPLWDLPKAKALACELEETLKSELYVGFLENMYGNEPDCWSDDLTGIERLRVITNYFTRMRFCDAEGRLQLSFKGTVDKAPAGLYPWYAVPDRKVISDDLIFGHWAALKGQCPVANLFPIDTGCLWGGELTALRLQDRKRFTVPGL